MPAGKWELTLLPLDQIIPQVDGSSSYSARVSAAPALKKPATPVPSRTHRNTQAAGRRNQQAADGFLVNGSVNNSATSQFALSQAFGNRRSGSRASIRAGWR